MILHNLWRIALIAWDGLNGTAVWLVVSFTAAGVLRNLLSPARLQRALGNSSPWTVLKAVLSGLFIPICSCGTIPLGISLYYTGAYLGPTLAFMTATPILNPAALLLSFGFLGPRLALLYLVSGGISSLIIGLAANALAGPELFLPGLDTVTVPDEKARVPMITKLRTGVLWGLTELGPMVCRYVCLGMLLMGAVAVLVPDGFIKTYLGNPSLLSLSGAALLGTVMYICAVGHIPFIAMLVASGAAPGVAVTFLMGGTATNLPELLSLWRLIGKRCAVLYFSLVVLFSFLSGWIVNRLLMPGFVPFLNMQAGLTAMRIANVFSLHPTDVFRTLCACAVLLMGASSFVRPVLALRRKLFARS